MSVPDTDARGVGIRRGDMGELQAVARCDSCGANVVRAGGTVRMIDGRPTLVASARCPTCGARNVFRVRLESLEGVRASDWHRYENPQGASA